MNLYFFMITFDHMPNNMRSILSVLFILASLILITNCMTFSIAKPFITIFAFALNNIFNIMYTTINAGMSGQILKIKRWQNRCFRIYSWCIWWRIHIVFIIINFAFTLIIIHINIVFIRIKFFIKYFTIFFILLFRWLFFRFSLSFRRQNNYFSILLYF